MGTDFPPIYPGKGWYFDLYFNAHEPFRLLGPRETRWTCRLGFGLTELGIKPNGERLVRRRRWCAGGAFKTLRGAIRFPGKWEFKRENQPGRYVRRLPEEPRGGWGLRLGVKPPRRVAH